MTEIKKKTWPELFQKMLDGKKNVDIRLADFDVKEGDIMVFEEYNPETRQYTGRVLRRTIKNLNKLNFMEFHSPERMKQYGHWVMELK